LKREIIDRLIKEKAIDTEKNGKIDIKKTLLLHESFDKIALLAFDVYMGCKEKIFRLKLESISTHIPKNTCNG